jgi:hypothetical protein
MGDDTADPVLLIDYLNTNARPSQNHPESTNQNPKALDHEKSHWEQSFL